MLRPSLFVGLFGLFIAACGGAQPAAPTSTQNSNAPATAAPATAGNRNESNAAKPAESPAAKPSAPVGPKRISFTKGSTNAIEYFELEPGESRQFVVGAVKGQDLTVGSGGDLKITMLTKGKTVDEKTDEDGYNGTTIAGGDFVFEVTNTSKKKNKSSVNVIIQTIGDD